MNSVHMSLVNMGDMSEFSRQQQDFQLSAMHDD